MTNRSPRSCCSALSGWSRCGPVGRPARRICMRARSSDAIDPRYGATEDCRSAVSVRCRGASASSRRASDPNLLAAAGYALSSSATAAGRRRSRPPLPRTRRWRWIRRTHAHAAALAELRDSERRRADPGPACRPPARVRPSTSSATTCMRRSRRSRRRIACSTFPARRRAPTCAPSTWTTWRAKAEAEQAQMRKRAAAGFARARQYANDALALAERPSTGTRGWRRRLSRGHRARRARAEGWQSRGGRRNTWQPQPPRRCLGRAVTGTLLACAAGSSNTCCAKASGNQSRSISRSQRSDSPSASACSPTRKDPRRRHAAVIPIRRSQTLERSRANASMVNGK